MSLQGRPAVFEPGVLTAIELDALAVTRTPFARRKAALQALRSGNPDLGRDHRLPQRLDTDDELVLFVDF